MAVEAQYTSPTQVVETPAMKARIQAVADKEKISFAQVVRDMTRHAIEWRESATPAELYALRAADQA